MREEQKDCLSHVQGITVSGAEYRTFSCTQTDLFLTDPYENWLLAIGNA